MTLEGKQNAERDRAMKDKSNAKRSVCRGAAAGLGRAAGLTQLSSCSSCTSPSGLGPDPDEEAEDEGSPDLPVKSEATQVILTSSDGSLESLVAHSTQGGR